MVRSTARHSTHIGRHCLVGPDAHLVGCVVEDEVFIATGASIFHAARLGKGSEVRVNGVVHLRSHLPPGTTVPIGWWRSATQSNFLPRPTRRHLGSAGAADFPLAV